MKSIIASGLLLGMAHGTAAVAGPYVNIESNTGFYGSDTLGSVVETHAGYEGELSETTGWYVQAGPALLFPEGADSTVEFSGKAGVSSEVTENLEVYGEYSFVTGEELSSGVKAGLTYRF